LRYVGVATAAMPHIDSQLPQLRGHIQPIPARIPNVFRPGAGG
jgi:hypothetical protein